MLKLIALSGFLGAGAVFGGVEAGVLPCPLELTRSVLRTEVSAPSTGDYYEARTCTVWGGACHINGESMSQGRRALIAWSFDSGTWAGARVVAAVESAENLARESERRAALWIDAPASWSADERSELAAALADDADLHVLSTQAAEIAVERDGDEFSVTVPGVVELAGSALADRSCCTMPESRWYETLASTSESIVGNPSTCEFEGAEGLKPWSYEDENTAYVARVSYAMSVAP